MTQRAATQVKHLSNAKFLSQPKARRDHTLSHSGGSIADAKARNFYASKNAVGKAQSKLQQTAVPNARAKITDPQFDVFAGYHEFPQHTDFISTLPAAEALQFKRKNRRQKMQARRDRQFKQLQNQSLTDNLISTPVHTKKKELGRHKSNSPIKRRDGSNMKRNPNQLTPLKQEEAKRGANQMAKATSSQVGKRDPISQNSQFTLSSAQKEEADIDSNSIISEEDSAFEDFSPRNNRRAKKRIEMIRKQSNRENQEPTKIQGPMANEIITGNNTFRNTEKLDIFIEPPSRDEESRAQTKTNKKPEHRTSKTQKLFPLKRSTTQKNREHDIEGKVQTKSKKRSKYLEERERDKSRDSSYNMMSDKHYDQLSINVGNHAVGGNNVHRKFIKQANGTSRKQFYNINNQESGIDSNSVVSVITGTKQLNYFGGAKKSSDGDFQLKMKQTSHSSQKNNDQEKVIAQSKDVFADFESGRFPSFRRQRKRNEKIVNVYLQTPYKVNSYAEIKSSLYRAENNLKVHTALRNNQIHEVPKNAIEIEKVKQILAMNSNNNKVNRNNRSQDFGSIVSDVQQDRGSSQPTQNGHDSIFATRSSAINTKDNKFLNPMQRKIIKDRITQQETNIKQAFFEQLDQKLDRKIEMLNQQGRHLTKQNQLFNIYGPKENNWFNPNNALHKTLVNEMFQTSVAFSQENNTTPTPNPHQHVISEVYEQRCGTSGMDKELTDDPILSAELSKVHPYLPEDLKSRVQAIKEIEACITNSPYRRNSKNRRNLVKSKQTKASSIEEFNWNLQELIEKAKEMGLTKVQLNQMLQKQMILEEAERQLEKQLCQVKSGLTTSVNVNSDLPLSREIDYSTMKEQSLHVTMAEIRKSQEQANVKNKQLQSKSINEENQRIMKSVNKKTIEFNRIQVPQKQPSKGQKFSSRQTDHKEELQDYFDNKLDLKRALLKQEQKGLTSIKKQKLPQCQLDSNMFHAISDENKKLKIKSKFTTTESKSRSNQKSKRSNERQPINFIKNNIKNTVLPQILNQYNNGSETRRFDVVALNPMSDNDCETSPCAQKPLLNLTIMAESRAQEHRNIQRMSYNSNILSQSSAEMISNLPMNSARVQVKPPKQSPEPAYKKSSTLNESSKKNQKLRPYEEGQDSMRIKTRLVLESPNLNSKSNFPQQLTSIEKQNKMSEIYNIPNLSKPSPNNYLTAKHGKILPLERIKRDSDQSRGQTNTKRNTSIDRHQKSNYGNFYSEKFVNSEQTAILKTCFDKKKELQKMLCGIKNFKQVKRLPQIQTNTSVNYAPTQ